MKFPAKVFKNPLTRERDAVLLDKLQAILRVRYGDKEFNFSGRNDLLKSSTYRNNGRYNYSVYFSNRLTGDEVCFMFPIKSWNAEFFMCLEDKIHTTIKFLKEVTKEEE